VTDLDSTKTKERKDMPSKQSSGRNHTSKKYATQRIAAALMVLLAVVLGTSPAFASTAGTARPGIDMARASFVTPDIEAEPCTSARKTWVHIKFVYSGTICYGYKGTWPFEENSLVSFCPGNNKGSFTYTDDGGKPHTFTFEPDGAPVLFMYADAVSLTITGWEGDATRC
jgi:hypothetical protein